MTLLKTSLDEIRAILKNGLISQVADLVRERDRNDRRKYDLWMPMVRDWLRVGIIVLAIYVIENAHTLFSVLGVR